MPSWAQERSERSQMRWRAGGRRQWPFLAECVPGYDGRTASKSWTSSSSILKWRLHLEWQGGPVVPLHSKTAREGARKSADMWEWMGKRDPTICGRHRWKPQRRKKGGRACEEPICRSLWIRNFRRSSPYRKSSAIDQTSLGLGGWGSINFTYNWRILSTWTSTFHGPFAHEPPNSTLLKRSTAIYHFLCRLSDQRVSFSG